jgi:predicted Zn-dependent protease
MIHRLVVLAVATLLVQGCATTPSGRSQLMVVDDRQMNNMGAQAFNQLRSDGKLSRDPQHQRYVRCIADSLIAELPDPWRELPWEVEVFLDETPNAFALPGGKVGVNTGMFQVAQTADQLAAVVGHELAHVMYRHGAERFSQQIVAQTGLTVAAVAANAKAPENSQLILGALGAGAQIGVLLPFSRKHETEADLEGQRLMARAGFDPSAAITLWQRMQQAGGAGSPTFMSTHPNPQGRINQLQNALPQAADAFAQARAQGRSPSCRLQ